MHELLQYTYKILWKPFRYWGKRIVDHKAKFKKTILYIHNVLCKKHNVVRSDFSTYQVVFGDNFLRHLRRSELSRNSPEVLWPLVYINGKDVKPHTTCITLTSASCRWNCYEIKGNICIFPFSTVMTYNILTWIYTYICIYKSMPRFAKLM